MRCLLPCSTPHSIGRSKTHGWDTTHYSRSSTPRWSLSRHHWRSSPACDSLPPGPPADRSPLPRPLSERRARAIHYPVLLFFIGFTIVHVGLVLTTGMFRNLNQMYAARESADPVGFIVCAIAVAVLAVAWVVTKPGLLKRIAATTGKVQG